MDTIVTQRPMTSSVLRALRDYWWSACGDREMPSRRDLDPLSIPKLLPHVLLTDVFHAPLRFRFRLIGTFVTNFYERDVTGRWLDAALYGDNTDDMAWLFRECVRTRSAAATRLILPYVRKDWATIEALLMPLSAGGHRIDMLFGGQDTVAREIGPGDPGKRIVLDARA